MFPTSGARSGSGRLDFGMGGDLALVMLAQEPVDEVGDRSQGRLGRLAVRRVPRIRQQRDVDRAIALLLRYLDLPRGAILVVLALHDQDRHADMGERIAEIPLAELGVEPGAAPAVERVVRVGVPARKLCAQRARLERGPGAPASNAARVRTISAMPMSSVKKGGAISASPRTRWSWMLPA